MRVGLTEEEKIEHALALNLVRRHLSREQRRELVLKLRQKGWSTTRIAEKNRCIAGNRAAGYFNFQKIGS
ncbi:hypothetical protein [Rhodothermus marinus]|uniref:hypothetical protein n=1 Tax=Rhodothermus marinus TaxID=29549 RepID=UPI001FB2E731|nr:hypothetical protein [Rhodothermus marinus]